MALFHGSYFSDALRRGASFSIYLPNDIAPEFRSKHFERPTKTLFLLHGISGNHADWISETRIRHWAESRGIAVVMPSGQNGRRFLQKFVKQRHQLRPCRIKRDSAKVLTV